jgi:hypothetical protein
MPHGPGQDAAPRVTLLVDALEQYEARGASGLAGVCSTSSALRMSSTPTGLSMNEYG